MPKGQEIKQTDEISIKKLVEMAKEEIASGKVQYPNFGNDKEAELYKIRRWIITHSPHWRSSGVKTIIEEMKRLGLSD